LKNKQKLKQTNPVLKYEMALIVGPDVVAGDPESRTYRSIQELTEAIDEFKKNYEAFSAKNRQFLLIDTEAAFQAAQKQNDIRHAAKTFSDSIWEVLHALEKKRKMKSGRWTTKLGNALSKLYPIARLSLGLAQAIGDVYPRLNALTARRHQFHH
jgi:hypothetical protein